MAGAIPIATPETLPFWQGANRGELRIQRCNACGKHYFYPRPFCPKCASLNVVWDTVSGKARLLSYIINNRPLPPFDRKTPIIVAIVELAEGPQMMTNIVGIAPNPELLILDMPLRVEFEERGEMRLPVFAPDGDTT